MMTYREEYENGVNKLSQSHIIDYKLDARLLLEWVCSTSRHDLIVNPDRVIAVEEHKLYEELIAKRASHYPLQYIIGKQEFMGLDFEVNESVLIPRQDTEFVVEEALFHVHDGMSVLDMCTGSGCMLISIMKYKNNCEGLGVDISEDALPVARKNAIYNEVPAQFIRSDLYEEVSGKYDVIVSNPPYIRSSIIPSLMKEVKDNEPIIALDGYEDGLYFYKKIIEGSKEHLKIGGYLIFEIGHDQGKDVSESMIDSGYKNVEVKKDYAGNDRVVKGYFVK